MGSSVQPTDPGRPNLPPLSIPRVLSPDEFQQARTMTPTQMRQAPFPPVAAPLAPKDQTKANDPSAQPDQGTKLTGLGRILTQYVAAPMMDHPLTTAATGIIPGAGYVMAGLMGKDIVEYAAQKWHESQMTPEDRAKAEADPNRIPGERAAVEAAMLGLAPLVHAGMKAIKGEPVPTAAAGSEAPSGLQLAEAGGNARYSGLPVTPEIKSAVARHVDAVTDAWKTVVTPASRTPEATQAANILRATTGEMAAHYEQAAFKLDEFRRAVEPLPESDKLGFIDAVEGGRSQPTPEFQKAADIMRQTLDAHRDAIQALGTGKLDHFIEDYFPHIWTDPDRAADAFKIAGGTRPMEGSKAFLKQRTIPTTLEGIQAGLQPVSTNPVDLTLLKLREMQRYLMAHQSLSEMKDAGLVKFVRSGDVPPDGYARINDKVATVFGPRQGAVQLPEGANIAPQDVSVPGMRIMGQYHAPEPVARVVNNYLSPGLRGNAIYDAYRGLGNTLNQAQLGLSAFHLGMTSLDATVSRVALAGEYAAAGDFGMAGKKLVTAPVAPVSGIVQGTIGDLMNRLTGSDIKLGLGAKIRDAYLNPEKASPEMASLANAVQEAGGRIRQDSFYANSSVEKMVDAWKEGNPVKAGAYALPAFFEAAAKPLMEHVVPLQKLQVFGEMAQKILDELPAETTLADRRAALSKAWDSVDNRMGQVVYDNLFWNKTFKDLSMASVRSVGWNLGTIRELGGGVGDALRAPAKMMAGGSLSDALTHRAAYITALPITVGLYGALYQYLRTGSGPGELKDYFYPKTGEVDQFENPERVQLPSYMKDMIAYAGSPWQTLKHKVAPVPSAIFEMLQNQDFYGDQIRNPNDPITKQVQQEADYAVKELEPFAFRNLSEQAKRGDQGLTKAQNFVGITPAPRRVVKSDAQNLMGDYLGAKMPSGRTPEQVAAQHTRSDLAAIIRAGNPDDIAQGIQNAVDQGALTERQLTTMLKQAAPGAKLEAQFKRLSLPEALDVFGKATPREKALWADALATKIERSRK